MSIPFLQMIWLHPLIRSMVVKSWMEVLIHAKWCINAYWQGVPKSTRIIVLSSMMSSYGPELICCLPIPFIFKKNKRSTFTISPKVRIKSILVFFKFPMVFTCTQHLTRPLMFLFSVEHITHYYGPSRR